ncbi:MAG: hypothetical protein OQJ97_08245 [Rhodospirillales bacterium]|nr:hypothetical protein [Rhodospirillales bacterium]
MTVGSLFFFIFSLCSLALYSFAKNNRSEISLSIINLIFVAIVFGSIENFIPIVSFSILGYTSILIVRKYKNYLFFIAVLLINITYFIIIKKYTIVSGVEIFGFIYSTIGLSYLLFRSIHLIIDVRESVDDEIPTISQYINYQFFFLSFISGPILRYQEYNDNVRDASRTIDRVEINAAFERIILGLIKVFIVAVVAHEITVGLPVSFLGDKTMLVGFRAAPDFINLFFTSVETNEPIIRIAFRYLWHSFAFLVFLYFNFSGYMDIVIGVGRLFGFKISENFNHPFLAYNFIDFWARWHITLSSWFKTYLFNPLLKESALKFGRGKASTYIAVPALFITFLVMGIWHGTTPAYFIYGLLLGGGIALNMLYQLLAKQFFGRKKYKIFSQNTLYKNICRALMVSFFALSLSCLWLDIAQLSSFVKMFGILGIMKLWLIATIATFICFVFWEKATDIFARISPFLMGALFISGFIYLLIFWGGIANINFDETVAFLESFVSAVGVVLIVFSWSILYHCQTNGIRFFTIPLWLQLLLFSIARMMNAGAVPEFIYKGF